MDTIFYNGCISSLDSNDNFVEALGITNGVITFVGTTAEALTLSSDNKIDLGQKLMLPGFVDSHLHMVNYAFVENSVKLFDCKTVEDAVNLAKARLVADTSGSITSLYCRGWNEQYFTTPTYPSKKDLDAISEEIPIIMVRVCGHVAVCNTCGLNKLKVLKEFPEFASDVDFETGLIKENAVQFFYSALDKPSSQQVEAYIKLSMGKLNEKGITGVQSDDFASLPGRDSNLILGAYQSLQDKEEMTLRVYEQCLFERFEDLRAFLDCGHRTGQGGDFFTLGPIKLLQDGSLGAKTAALTQPYEGDSSNKGLIIFEQAELNEIVKTCHEHNMQLAVHCIGDRAMNMVMDALEGCMSKAEISKGRHGIVHAQITNPKILERMKECNMVAYIQPVFVGFDMDIVEARIGKDRMEKVYAWKSMLDRGIHAVGGSDAPVESFDILENIYFAVTRQNMKGHPEAGWIPDEKLSVGEAVKLFTKYPAYASFTEDTNGTIELGKRADLVILSDNLYETPFEDIKDIKVEQTIVSGKVVYQA